MLSIAEKERYNRQIILPEVGEAGQEKLKRARVLVIGAGGLGCPVLQYLTAAGVGTIGIADMDVVSESNLHRQILYTSADIGEPKVRTAAAKLAQQNPFVAFRVHPQGITVENALELLQPYDVVVDGSDSFPTRYLVSDACTILQKPLVFGAISRFEGQVSVFNYNHGPSYRCLFPAPPAAGEVLNCAEAGVLGVLPGIIGTLQANEVLKIICGWGDVASGKLLLFDALSLSLSSFKFSRTKMADEVKVLQPSYGVTCAVAQELTAAELKTWQAEGRQVQLLDVREPQEYEHFNIGGELVPLSKLSERMEELQLQPEVVVHCQSGMRSKKAIGLLQARFPEVLFYNLAGGLAAWQSSA
ncbi:HesA/MoeB/ThiF family protein [Pontibacter chitinilyticus]|uniref:HesA/MoeB/ThiF family protein n=1 Tax=Pontibacter chitinilyticus TaxID=2674989 RepID=UPI0032196E8A